MPPVDVESPGLVLVPEGRQHGCEQLLRAAALDLGCHGHHSPSSAVGPAGWEGSDADVSCGASCELRCCVGDGSCTARSCGASCGPPSRGAPRARARSPLGQAQTHQRGGARAAAGRDRAVPLVGEAGQDAGGLLEGAQRRTARGRHRPSRAQVVDEGLGAPRGLVVEELPVDHHDRSEVAGRVALDVLQGDLAVLGGLAVADAQVLLEGLEDGVAAHDRAERVGAHAHLVVAARPAPVHGVEGRDRGHLGRGEAQDVRAELHPGARDVSLLRLHEVQQGQEGGPGVRVAGDDLARVGLQPGPDVVRVGGRGQFRHAQADAPLRRRGGHRSTPPITGSMDATATMTSATWPPSHIAAMA